MAFIDTVMPYAHVATDRFNAKTGGNIDPRWIAAQWQLETGGKINSNNNLAGIKSGYDSKFGYRNGTYLGYASLDGFAKDYGDFISQRSYRNAGVSQAKTASQFYGSLKAGGYATDPNYVSKATNVFSSLFGKGGGTTVGGSNADAGRWDASKGKWVYPDGREEGGGPNYSPNEESIYDPATKWLEGFSSKFFIVLAVLVLVVIIFMALLQVVPLKGVLKSE